MERKRIIFSLSFLTITLSGVMHHLALEYKLYFGFFGLDLLVHLLLSFGILLLFLYFFYVPLSAKNVYILLSVILLSVIIGVAWELFEVWGGVFLDSYQWGNTVLDVIMDVVGGMTAYLIFNRIGPPAGGACI